MINNWHQQVAAENTIPESTAPVSGVVLTFMANLRQGFLNERLPLTHDQQMPPNTYISLLDHSSLTGAGAQSSPWSQGASSKVLFATSLQILLKGLIEYILSSRKSPLLLCIYCQRNNCHTRKHSLSIFCIPKYIFVYSLLDDIIWFPTLLFCEINSQLIRTMLNKNTSSPYDNQLRSMNSTYFNFMFTVTLVTSISNTSFILKMTRLASVNQSKI